MAKLTEPYVQKIAVKWLTFHCQEKLGTRVVLAETQAWIRKDEKLGYGCADGLVVAQLSDGKIHTASLEAKSAKTFRDIILSLRMKTGN